MDKKDIKEYILIISKIYLMMFVGIIIPLNIVVTIIGSLFEGNILSNVISNTVSLIQAMLLIAVIVYGALGLGYLFIYIRRNSQIINSKEYVRELPKYFPPAIASALLDMSVETTTDYTATIAYLISKKYIELEEDNVRILNNSIINLSSHEKYVYQCITQNQKFQHLEFKKLVIDDAEKMGFVKKGTRPIHFLRNFLGSILLAFLCSFLFEKVQTGIFHYIIGIIGVIASISIFAVVGYSIYLLPSSTTDKEFYRTTLGNKEASRWSGVKKYLKEYTLISDRNLQDTVLFEDYIPYAIALNEAKAIEKYIENNEAYRKLIYGQVYNFYK